MPPFPLNILCPLLVALPTSCWLCNVTNPLPGGLPSGQHPGPAYWGILHNHLESKPILPKGCLWTRRRLSLVPQSKIKGPSPSNCEGLWYPILQFLLRWQSLLLSVENRICSSEQEQQRIVGNNTFKIVSTSALSNLWFPAASFKVAPQSHALLQQSPSYPEHAPSLFS